MTGGAASLEAHPHDNLHFTTLAVVDWLWECDS
jgi:hypothetical protein